MMMNPAPKLSETLKRTLGAYYTPEKAVALMAEWVLDHSPQSILEPSFGDGGFLVAVQVEAQRRQVRPIFIGAELHESAFDFATDRLHLDIDGHAGDFLSLTPRPVDAVIGNPPFVRIRHLSAGQRASALQAADDALGFSMDPSGSTWMPFVLHSTQFVAGGGALALVLPLELTYVRYARPLWAFLGKSFGRLKVVRTYERMFPDLMQDVVILLAEERGGSTDNIEFQVTQTLKTLDSSRDVVRLRIDEVADGDRAFVSAILPSRVRGLVRSKLIDATQAVGDVATVRIGYVAGDKDFFHPGAETIHRYKLPDASLRPTISKARPLKGAGLFTGALPEGAVQSLWRPSPEHLEDGERRYIKAGEELEIDNRYKCRVRTPWFVVPGVEIPDALVSVFSDSPLMLINNGGYAASNSLLTATMRHGERVEDLVAGWYSSVTQLFIELEVHSLGGGVLIAVPNELSRVRVPIVGGSRSLLRRLDRALSAGDFVGARDVVDQAMLKSGAITAGELELIRAGTSLLQKWRKRPTTGR